MGPSSRSLSACALVLGAALASKSAHACGMCVDMGMQRVAWWAMAVPVLGVVLVLELVTTAVGWRLLRYPARLGRGGLAVVAFALALGLSIFGGGSGFLLGAGLVLVLGPTFLLSLQREMPGSVLAKALRLGGVAVPVVAALVFLSPPMRSTESLVSLGSSLRGGGAWVTEELARRPDALAVIEGQSVVADDARFNRLLRLHAKLGGDAVRRAELCADPPRRYVDDGPCRR